MNWGLYCLASLAALSALAAAIEALCEARDHTRFPPPGQMVEAGGRRLHLLCQGTATGPTVVIEQGAGSPSILWWPIQRQIAAFARVCTYDRAGYLWSDPAPRTRSLQARAEDLHALLANARIPGPYILVAHSFGGPLIRLYARLYPTQVAGMVLVDTTEEQIILRPSYDAYVSKIRWFTTIGEITARLGLVRLAATFLRTEPDGMEPSAWHALKALAVRPAFFRAMGDDPPALSRDPELTRSLSGAGTLGDIPLAVITHCLPFPGAAAVLEDGWLDAQHRLAALSSRGELIRAEHSNHMVQSDQPELVVDTICKVVVAAQQ